MATTFFPPKIPNINLPECPSTVESGKLGISLYGKECSISISETNPPSPVPRIIPISGLKFVFSVMKLALSFVFCNIVCYLVIKFFRIVNVNFYR